MGFNRLRNLGGGGGYVAGTTAVKLRFDDDTGLYLIVNITNANGGTVTPALGLLAPPSGTGAFKALWTAAAALNANGVYAYLFMPQGIENLSAPVEGLQERVALPLASEMVLNMVIATATVTMSFDIWTVSE